MLSTFSTGLKQDMMNLRGCERKVMSSLRWYSSIFLEGLRKISVWIAGVLAKIQSQDFPCMKQGC
jgi:hypothetical protein